MCDREDWAISFATVKACYPLTIKGELFSLLCFQPKAFPTSLKTLTRPITRMSQYLPQIWNGQAKAPRHARLILGPSAAHRGEPARLGYRVLFDFPQVLVVIIKAPQHSYTLIKTFYHNYGSENQALAVHRRRAAIAASLSRTKSRHPFIFLSQCIPRVFVIFHCLHRHAAERRTGSVLHLIAAEILCVFELLKGFRLFVVRGALIMLGYREGQILLDGGVAWVEQVGAICGLWLLL